jgi:hypothetical protein
LAIKENQIKNDWVRKFSSENGYHKEHKQQQMLVRMW